MKNVKVIATADEIVKMIMDTIDSLDSLMKKRIANEEYSSAASLNDKIFILEHILNNVTETENDDENEEE